jgi:hypothetical protein
MNTFLIGVTGDRTEETKKVIFAISNCLSLMHINMRQPFIDVLASITGLNALAASSLAGNDKIAKLNCTVAAFEREFYSGIYGLNNRFFIETVGERLSGSVRGFTATTSNLFSGHIVSGLSHPQEAEYIRAKGGIVVHVLNKSGEGWPSFHRRDTRLYDVYYQLNDAENHEKEIAATLIPLIRNANKRAA